MGVGVGVGDGLGRDWVGGGGGGRSVWRGGGGGDQVLRRGGVLKGEEGDRTCWAIWSRQGPREFKSGIAKKRELC